MASASASYRTCGTTELDMALHEVASATSNGHGAVQQQRRGLEAIATVRGRVQRPCVKQRAVAGRGARQSNRSRLVVPVVANVSVIEVELVVPGVGGVTGFHRLDRRLTTGRRGPLIAWIAAGVLMLASSMSFGGVGGLPAAL
jgi:hypothetical protein